MFSDRFAFLVGVLSETCHHVPASLADIAGMATWTSNFIHSTTPELKDGRKVFCFRNVTTGCIRAFERFSCLMKLSVGKPWYYIIKLTFAGEFSLFTSSL